MSLFREIILQQLDEFKTEIRGSSTKLYAFKSLGINPKNGKMTNNGT